MLPERPIRPDRHGRGQPIRWVVFPRPAASSAAVVVAGGGPPAARLRHGRGGGDGYAEAACSRGEEDRSSGEVRVLREALRRRRRRGHCRRGKGTKPAHSLRSNAAHGGSIGGAADASRMLAHPHKSGAPRSQLGCRSGGGGCVEALPPDCREGLEEPRDSRDGLVAVLPCSTKRRGAARFSKEKSDGVR